MNYWKERIIKDEEHAQQIAATFGKREQQYYRRIVKAINRDIDALYTKLTKGEPISRTELWNYEHFKRLRSTILEQCGQLGLDQISITEQALDKVVQDTLGQNWKKNEPTSILNEQQTKRYLDQAWSGESYSSRIYKNCNELAAKLQEEISNMICLGKSPDAVKAAIMEQCNVSYNVANRLIRTEASYTFNQANKQRYEEMGAKQIEILTEPDCCEQCEELRGVYDFNTAPQVPIHPFAAAVTYQFWKISK